MDLLSQALIGSPVADGIGSTRVISCVRRARHSSPDAGPPPQRSALVYWCWHERTDQQGLLFASFHFLLHLIHPIHLSTISTWVSHLS